MRAAFAGRTEKTLLVVLVLFVLAIAPAVATEPEDIRYVTEDYAPSNYLENGKLTGIAVEVLRAMWARMNVAEQKIQVLPWARGYVMAQSERNCLLFAMPRSAERESLFKWVGPIYRGNYTLYSAASKSLTIRNLEEAKKYRIGVIREDFSEKDLLSKGFSPEGLFPVKSVEQLKQMLFFDRVDLLYLYEDTLKTFAPLIDAKESDFFPSFTVSANVMHFAFSKSTDDEIVGRFQKALDEVDAQRRAIVIRYKATP